MNNDNELNLLKQYRNLETRLTKITTMEAPTAKEYGGHLLKMSKFLVNHGELLKTHLNIASPKELAADFAQQALGLADNNDHILKAESYLLLANARWFFPCPSHKENAMLCEKAIVETSAWFNSSEGVNSNEEEYLRVKQITLTAKGNRALFLHYANDFVEAIKEYQSLLDETKKNGSDHECFTLILKLANVLNDANMISTAQELLFSANTEWLITSDNQRFRLHVAQSHSHALSGQMGKALEDINMALRYFNSSDFHVETQGNLLIRAARYYIRMSAYEDAMTMLPDLIGSEDSYTGGEYKLNLAVVRTMLWIGHGRKEQAMEALSKLDSMVRGMLENESSGELPDQYWDHAALKAQFEQRFHGDHAAMVFIRSLPGIATSTIDTINSNQYPLLLQYCEASIKIKCTKNLEPQIITLLCSSVVDDQWERWKAPLCAAKWFLSEGQVSNAILWTKLSCTYVLSLSVPLLRSVKQRERITNELMSPFNFLENALCLAARIPEAQSIRAFRLHLECEMRFPYFSESDYHVFSGSGIELNLSDKEAAFFNKWDVCSKQAKQAFEQGEEFADCVKSTGMFKLFTTTEPKSVDLLVQMQDSQKSLHQRAADECFLSYWVYENQIMLVAEPGTTRKNMILQITPQEMRHVVYQLRVAIEAGNEWHSLAKSLYASLIAPVVDVISGAEKLIVSGNDALRYLPIAALFDGKNYLIEKFELIYSNVGNVEPTRSVDDARIMFLGTRSHISGQEQLNPDRELAHIQKQFTVDTVLIDQHWDLAQWKQKLTQQHSILHLCCHFDFQPHDPSSSHFMLSDGRQLDISSLLEIDGWERIELLFLATCNSAIGGESSISNANLSLADTFISAGVKRVVASFRPVSDIETVQFSADFYRLLRKTGSIERSLQLAQCEAIKMDNPVWSAYGCWAP